MAKDLLTWLNSHLLTVYPRGPKKVLVMQASLTAIKLKGKQPTWLSFKYTPISKEAVKCKKRSSRNKGGETRYFNREEFLLSHPV